MRARREPLICLEWVRSNGVIERTIASMRSNSRSSRLSSWAVIWPMPGIMPSIDFSEPIFLMAAICWRKSSKVKSSSARNLRCHLLRPGWRSNAFSACSMRVSTSPMSRMREAIRSGWKTSKSFTPSPVLANMIGRPVTDGDRQRGTTAGVAVELGEHDAGEVDALLEGVRGVDGGLADHRVDDEQHLVGLDRGADVGGLLHEVGVDGEAAGGVDDDDVVLGAAGLLDAGAGDRDRVAERLRVPSPVGPTASWPPTLPRSGAKTGTPARSPTTSSWVTALGRCRSAATRIGVWPCSLSQRAELAGEGGLARRPGGRRA